jgi:predicted ATPase
VCLAELASVSDPELVAEAVAAALGIRNLVNEHVQDVMAAYLRTHRLLLILDNCDHLVDACGQLVAWLLGECPRVRVLVTSRELLGITGEAIWTVAPLSVVDPAQFNANDAELGAAVAGSEAARLFIDRVQLVMPLFDATATSLRAVARITHQLDGMPLALELAAAQVSVLSVTQIAERLSNALGLLTDGSRTAPDRQQTMRATLDWSYRLLSEPERRLFQRVSVFAGSWSLEAAEAICVGRAIPLHALLELLGGLVRKSLVSIQSEPDGQ